MILNRAKRSMKRRTYMEYHIGEFDTGLCKPACWTVNLLSSHRQ